MTHAKRYMQTIVENQHQGIARGIPSICSANPWVLEAAFRLYLDAEKPVLIESTCNQVNQYGGYTGMTPADFRRTVESIADQAGFPRARILLGGDHLGPTPWQEDSAERAMAESRQLVADYVRSGFTKIHLDASMRLGDDPDQPLNPDLAASRAADLAVIAEATFAETKGKFGEPVYVIGSEVPLPGGIQEKGEEFAVTDPDDVRDTIEITKRGFLASDLPEALDRVIAVVVQPGVEYGDEDIFEYDRAAANELKRFIEEYPKLVYEAHSTDYQTRNSLKQLVEDHFAILKVGPALTFAFREAIFALAMIEEELLGERHSELSYIRRRLDQAMLDEPKHWRKYYQGDENRIRFARKYSFSDRSRYYWPAGGVQNATLGLLENLNAQPIPLTLLSQFFPVQYRKIREGVLRNSPNALVLDRIQEVLRDYQYACGGDQI